VGERLVAEIWRLPNRKSSGNRVGESKPGGRSSEEDDVVEPTWAGDAEARGEVLAAPPLAAAGDAVAGAPPYLGAFGLSWGFSLNRM
jgi:hypothetical protein